MAPLKVRTFWGVKWADLSGFIQKNRYHPLGGKRKAFYGVIHINPIKVRIIIEKSIKFRVKIAKIHCF